MKVAILNDTHCGARNSSTVFIDYQADFYRKVFFPYLREHGIKNILHLGDYYEHRKFVNFQALSSNRVTFLEKLRSFGITMDLIPGNHDTYFKNTSDLCSLKELMIGFTDVVNIIMEPTELVYGKGKPVALVPWINAGNYAESMQFIADSRAPICAGHFEFAGFELYPGNIAQHGMSTAAFDKFESVLSGHYHTKSSKGNVTYLGAQMEFNWADVDDPKFFHILDTVTGEIEAVRNPLTLFKKVVYDDVEFDYSSFDYSVFDRQYVKVVVARKTNAFMFEKFIDSVQLRPVHDLKVAEVGTGDSEHPHAEDVVFEDTVDLMTAYIDSVETFLDKEKLKGQLIGLYREAQEMEDV